MTSVLGLDLAARASGVALPTGRTLTLRPSAKLAVAARIHWVEGAVMRIVRLYRPAVVVIEGYAPNSVGILSTIRLAEVGGAVRARLYEAGVPYIEVHPTRLKRYATGNGNAPKERMILAAVVAGATPANHDEADAALLRALGIHGLDSIDLLDDDDEHRAARLEVVAAIDWGRP